MRRRCRSATPRRTSVLGVMNLTCWRRDAGATMVAADRRAEPAHRDDAPGAVRPAGAHPAARLPRRLPPQPGRRDRRGRRPADAQRPGPRAAPARRPGRRCWPRSTEALATGRRQQLLVDLPSGTDRARAVQAQLQRGGRHGRRRPGAAHRADVRRAPATGAAAVAAGRGGVRGAVDQVPPGRRPAPSAPVSGWSWRASRAWGRRRWPAPCTRAGPPPPTCGSSTPTVRPAVDRGPGRRAGHGRRHARAHPPRPAAARGAARARRRARGRTASPPDPTATGWSRPSARSAATATPTSPRLLSLFPRTVEVPPLRHHLEDVAELVPHLLARLTRGRQPRGVAGGDAGADAQPVAGQRRAALPGAAGDGRRAGARASSSRATCRRSAGRPRGGC